MDFAPQFEKYRGRELRVLTADYDSIEVNDPPKDLSHTTTMELDEIDAVVRESKLPKSLVKVADKDPVRLFTSVAKKHKLDPLEQEAEEISKDWNTIAFYFKDKFRRRRPSEVLKEHDKDFPINTTSSSISPSYPSGHSMMGYGLAEFYKEKYPYLSDEWDNIADVIAHSRIQLGVHFPSDNKASQSIVDQVVGQQKESSERLRTTIFGVDPEGKLLHGFGGQGFYKFPGGGVDPGESITDAAKRELLEEAGYSVDSIEELPGLDTSDSVGAGSAKGHMGHGSSLTKYLLARLGNRDESLLGSEGDAISNLQTAPIDEVLQGLEGDMLFGSGVAESNHAALTKLKGMLNKTAADSHVETRRKQRAKYLDPKDLKKIESRVKKTKDLPDGANYITLPHGRKAVVRTDGGKSHVATILGPAMRPPGRDISSLLIKASGFNKELFLKEAMAVVRRYASPALQRMKNIRKVTANQPRRKGKLKSPSQPTVEPTAQSPVNTQPTTTGMPNQAGYFGKMKDINPAIPLVGAGGVGVGLTQLGKGAKPYQPNKFKSGYNPTPPGMAKAGSANDLSVLTAVPTQNLDLIIPPEYLERVEKTSAYKDYRPRGTLYLLDGKGGVMADKPTADYNSTTPYFFPGGGIFEEEKVDRLPTSSEIVEGVEREALEELGTKLKNVRVLQDEPANVDMPDWWRERQKKKRGVDYKGIAEFFAAAERGGQDKSIYGADNDEFKGNFYPIDEVASALEANAKPGDDYYEDSMRQARLLRSLLEKTSASTRGGFLTSGDAVPPTEADPNYAHLVPPKPKRKRKDLEEAVLRVKEEIAKASPEDMEYSRLVASGLPMEEIIARELIDPYTFRDNWKLTPEEYKQFRYSVIKDKKKLYPVARPFALAERYGIDLGLPEEELAHSEARNVDAFRNFSYPSFHTARGAFLAETARDLVPEDKQHLVDELISRIGRTRIQQGVHTHQDVAAGETLGREAAKIYKEKGIKTSSAKDQLKHILIKKAALEDEFQPDLTPDDLKALGVYDQVYGDAPSEASMKEWPEHWINKQDPLGWLQWYDRYSGGRRTDDDERQMKRWKSFKARHLAQYLKKPTPRRAAALRNWGIDVEKY